MFNLIFMSEISNISEQKALILANYMSDLLNGENAVQLLDKYNVKEIHFSPKDVVNSFEILFKRNVSIENIKFVSNKLFNILNKNLQEYAALKPRENTILQVLMNDNNIVLQKLNESRDLIKSINKSYTKKNSAELIRKFEEIQKFTLHYTVIENVIFPILESKWKNFQCVKILWSFHDDIRANLIKILSILKAEKFDLISFNNIVGKIYFNISTIVFREDRILFPLILETISSDKLLKFNRQVSEIGLPFADISKMEIIENEENFVSNKQIKLPTGNLTIKELNLIFNALPVDMTFVDENDRVQYFSDPPHRIFPRTKAIIGRKVQLCHPPESVHIVNEIITSFKNGEKDVAKFWFRLGNKFILIQYFALRTKSNEYKGTLEVSQEISEIQAIKGERKLLDW
jgi:DUF438 domain-containing protein